MPRILKSKLSFDEIKHLYVNEEMTLTDIAKIAGIHYLTVRKKLMKIGVKTRTTITETTRERFRIAGTRRKRIIPLTDQQKRNISTGVLNSTWAKNAKGTTVRNGYVSITKGERRYENVHRIIMEEHLGRKLNKGEVVHHIDGNRKNNSLDNLIVMDSREHARLHALERNHLRCPKTKRFIKNG